MHANLILVTKERLTSNEDAQKYLDMYLDEYIDYYNYVNKEKEPNNFWWNNIAPENSMSSYNLVFKEILDNFKTNLEKNTYCLVDGVDENNQIFLFKYNNEGINKNYEKLCEKVLEYKDVYFTFFNIHTY